MAKLLMRVEGLDGQIELMSDRVVIKREGVWNMLKFGFNAKREIPLGAISEVAFRDASVFRFGEIEFVRSGRSTDEKKKNNTNTVRFGKKVSADFEKLKEMIFELASQQTPAKR